MARLTREEYALLLDVNKPLPDKVVKKKEIGLVAFELNGIPTPTKEYKFHPDRRWRFDYAWVDKKVAVEQEGGIWIKGRHNHPTGMINDMEKYNSAVELGWRVLRYQPNKFDYEQIRNVLNGNSDR